jgi:hypothetical protein
MDQNEQMSGRARKNHGQKTMVDDDCETRPQTTSISQTTTSWVAVGCHRDSRLVASNAPPEAVS